MRVMFIHPNFPAQFGHLAQLFAREYGWQCTCVTSIDTTHLKNLPFVHVNYKVEKGPQPKTFRNPSQVSVLFDHGRAIYKGMQQAPQLKPDLVVGHMSYGTLLYLRVLYDCPFVGYFELLPAPFWTDGLVFRDEFPPPDRARIFNADYHSLTHLQLNAVDAGYTPTLFQWNMAPAEYRYKFQIIHDGIETEAFRPKDVPRPCQFRGIPIDADTKVVTYVSRGLESIRGFDIFMKTAKRICQEMDNVIFLIAGGERTHYGHEMYHIQAKTFKDYVLAQDNYDLSRFHFLGHIPLADLASLYTLSDLHIYFTAPYVLSWSLLQAMSSGCKVVGSATPPLQEVIEHGKHGLLADLEDVEAHAQNALAILRNPAEHAPLGQAARERVIHRYELRKCGKRLANYFEDVVAGNLPQPPQPTPPPLD